MRRSLALALVVPALAFSAVLLDRIAIVVNNQPIKTSDIERDLRVTEFLNNQHLDVSSGARKQAAGRLVDQALIRREIEVAQYTEARPEQVQKMLTQVRSRYRTEAAYNAALNRYGITAQELNRQLAWQITVLAFIDQRFRPSVLIGDDDVGQYYRQHRSQYGSRSLEEVRDQIEEQLTGERVNQQFFGWLEEQRKGANIHYLEADLE